jgi:phosphatidate cytidylyltransferase
MQTCKLICNPAHNQYFFPTLWIVVGFLSVTLLVLLVLVRFDLRALAASSLFHRWRVWAVIAPIYGLALFVGPLTTLLLVLFLTFQGLREYAHLVTLGGWYQRVLLIAGFLPAPIALLSIDAFQALPPVLLIVGTLEPVLLPERERTVRHFAFAVLGWGYIAWFLAYMMLIDTNIRGGVAILLAIGFGTALSDVGAFAVGKRFGRHRMAPRLSPNKTWEGAIGSFLGAYVGVGIMAFALPGKLVWLLLALFPIVIALGAIWGDLLESSIKREFQVKDAGSWLPGFGGLLDRIDSLIIVLPLAYYFLRVVS